jgi:hypothetical protein
VTTRNGAHPDRLAAHLVLSFLLISCIDLVVRDYRSPDLYEHLPSMLLDPLETIDSDRIAALVEYFSEYAEYLVVALLPEDAAALDDDYQRVTEI